MQLGPHLGFGAYPRGFAPTLPPFSPTDLSDLALWLDASDMSTITQVMGSVSQLDDKSGNNYHAVQASASKQPVTATHTINGLNALGFDGSDDTMAVASAFDTGLTQTDTTQFHVIAYDALSGATWAFAGSGSSTRFGFEFSHLGQFRVYSGNSSAAIASTSLSLSTPYIVAARRTGNALSGYLNGGGISASTTNGNGGSISNCFMGSFGGSPNFFNGRYGETIIYKRSLSDAEINQVGNYLAAKWGLAWTDF